MNTQIDVFAKKVEIQTAAGWVAAEQLTDWDKQGRAYFRREGRNYYLPKGVVRDEL